MIIKIPISLESYLILVFFPKDMRNNEDQKIQPPLQSNVIQGDEPYDIDEMEV